METSNKMFYNDTAICGNTPALMLAYNFWGADHILFGADYPLGDYYYGLRSYRNTIDAIEAMNASQPGKTKIFMDNIINCFEYHYDTIFRLLTRQLHGLNMLDLARSFQI